LPPLNAGPDREICLGDSAQLNGSGASIYSWSPPNTLNDNTIPNPIATPNATTTYYLTGYDVGGNIILNGNFENGNVGFTSDYNYSSDLWPEIIIILLIIPIHIILILLIAATILQTVIK